MLEITCCYVILHLNLKRLRFTVGPMTQRTRQSRENVNPVRTCHNIMPRHATLNCIMIHVTTLMQTLKTECDVHETSQSITIGS